MNTTGNQITPTIKEQILNVCGTAEVNMFDCDAVMSVANREGWLDLADYLSDRKNRGAYGRFILTGKTDTDGGGGE